MAVRTQNPCHPRANVAPRVSGAPPDFPCADATEAIHAELASLGKAGVKIELAREGVMEILQSESSCSEWFEAKEANSTATFQSLHFSIDEGGPHDVLESRMRQSLIVFRQPYVARATQNGGSDTTIVLNAYGAFFRVQGIVQKEAGAGGPLQMDGTRLLTVGGYDGDTLKAQMLTLMHEFGHIIDLLPEDADDLDGKSVRNTNEVLSHCRTQIEARERLWKQAAKR